MSQEEMKLDMLAAELDRENRLLRERNERLDRENRLLRERNERLDREAEQQKPWVGLTDEERNKLWRDLVKWGDPSHDDEDLMKAIEAKLRKKNR